MRRIFSVLLFLFLLFPQIAYANGAGLPPFFKVNDKLSISNPLQTFGITSQSFLIPQDFAPEKYLVNQPISFEIDETQLQSVIPEEILRKVTYAWDYGDGSKSEGLRNTHAYLKSGSYILILTINIHTNDPGAPTQFIDSFLINILPEISYNKLPQAIIKINDTQVTDPLNKPLDVNFKNQISFDASASKVSSSGIVEYLWNFGDGETGTGSSATHKYADQYFETVVLRIKDANGFISDTFVGLKNNPDIKVGEAISKSSQQKQNYFKYLFFIIPILILIILLIVIMKHQKKKSIKV